MCLTETYAINDFHSDQFAEFCVYISPAKKKLSHHGRSTGVVIALIHMSLMPYIKRIATETDNAVVFRIAEQLLGKAKPIVMVFT